MDSTTEQKSYDLGALAIYDPAQREVRKEFVSVKWQEGVIPVCGVNGAFIEDVLEIARDRIASLNQGDFRCRENSLAVTHIEEAMNWLVRRRLNRLDEGVQGTMQPHGKGY